LVGQHLATRHRLPESLDRFVIVARERLPESIRPVAVAPSRTNERPGALVVIARVKRAHAHDSGRLGRRRRRHRFGIVLGRCRPVTAWGGAFGAGLGGALSTAHVRLPTAAEDGRGLALLLPQRLEDRLVNRPQPLPRRLGALAAVLAVGAELEPGVRRLLRRVELGF